MKAQRTNPFLSFPVNELEWFRRGAGFGYLILALASFVAMSFFITHNMIGTEKPVWDSVNGFNWSIGQMIYAGVSLAFAFGFNVFTWFFYQVEPSAKERAWVLAVAVAFPMFAEIGQSMTRAEQTRHESAIHSESFKTMQKRVENGGNTGTDTALASLIASASADKAKAETALSQCGRYQSEQSRQQCQRKQEQAIASARGKIESYQMTGVQAQGVASSQLSSDTQTLKALEGDTDFLQPIVRLLMGFGLPALLASFFVSFSIIGAIEVSMSYLGGLLRQIKEAMRAKGADISVSSVKARMMESPIVSSLHSTGEVIAEEMGKAHTANETLRRKVSGEDKPHPTPPTPENGKDGGYTPRPALTTREALEKVLSVVTKGKAKGETFSIQEVEQAFEVVSTFEGAERVPALDLQKITDWLNSKNRPTPNTETDTHGQRDTHMESQPYTDKSGESVRVNTRTNTHTDTEKHTEEKPDYTDKLRQYEAVKNAPVGAVCGCPWCGGDFTKKTYNHRFCVPAHKDDFWNAIKPERLEAKEGRDKRRRAKATA
jgi:hypothetical protein